MGIYDIEYDKGKMINLVKKDLWINRVVSDLIKRGHSENNALKVAFTTGVLGDSVMISKYEGDSNKGDIAFNVYDRVYEEDTNARGVVVEVDKTLTNPYGVLFEDVDEDEGLWWCNNSMIRKDKESSYDVQNFIRKIKRRK